ncbi:MAG TPA: hypothetical protein VMB05_11585 [Solirubrobacteraceae bacterium]|nr:hypothetical protein [Solirubrobacteraceae bacterium]
MAAAPASSPTAPGVDDLKTLVLSYHPLIVEAVSSTSDPWKLLSYVAESTRDARSTS